MRTVKLLVAGFSLIKIDVSGLKDERENLSEFLASRINVSVVSKGTTLLFNKEELSARNLKTFVKKFLHVKNLSESYRVVEEEKTIRIVRRKSTGKHGSKKKGTKPSPYSTLPYFFPSRR